MKFEVISDNVKERSRSILQPLIDMLVKFNISPNVYTTLSLVFCGISGIYFSKGYFKTGALIMLLGGLFDIFDGQIARTSNRVTKFGALFDSTLDRYAEFLIFLGIGVYFVHSFVDGNPMGLLVALTVFVAIFGSLMVSYVRARAEGLGFDCKVGLLQRPERIILVGLGGLISEVTLILAMIIIAVFANITAIQRVYHIWYIENSPKWKTPAADVEHDEFA